MHALIAISLLTGLGVSAPEGDKLRVAVLALRHSDDVPANLVQTLEDLVPQELDALGPFKAITTRDIAQMLDFESQKQLANCSSDTSCLAQIAGALGVDYLVSGSVTRIEATTLIQLQLLNVKAARVDGRVTKEHQGGPAELLESMRVATRQLVRDVLEASAGSLMLAVSEEGASIRVDRSIVGVTPLDVPLTVAGGSHTVEVEKEGFVVFRRDVDIKKDQTTRLEVGLRPSPEYLNAYQQRVQGQRRLTYIGLGLGGAGLVGSALFWAGGRARAEDLRERIDRFNATDGTDTKRADAIDRATTRLGRWDTAALVSLVIGVTAGAAGGYVFLTGDDPDRYHDAPTGSVSVGLSHDAVSIQIGGAL